MHRNLTKADYVSLAEFRHAMRKFLYYREEAAKAIGLTSQQQQALLMLKGDPHRDYLLIGELAERLQIRHHSAVGLVNRLATVKLVERLPAGDDRRQVHVHITALGEQVLERLSAAHFEELQQMATHLNALLHSLAARRVLGESQSLEATAEV